MGISHQEENSNVRAKIIEVQHKYARFPDLVWVNTRSLRTFATINRRKQTPSHDAETRQGTFIRKLAAQATVRGNSRATVSPAVVSDLTWAGAG